MESIEGTRGGGFGVENGRDPAHFLASLLTPVSLQCILYTDSGVNFLKMHI